MSVDIARFHETFFEESLEGLATMESGLLLLASALTDQPSAERPDAETIDEVFRAAHSIKGGSGVFGFTDVSEFTHFLETLLDELRCNKRSVTGAITDLLLNSVDCLRAMLDAKRQKTPLDEARIRDVAERLRQTLAVPGAAPAAPPPAKAPAPIAERCWRISFRPHSHFFRTGNEPLRLLNELRSLGDCTITADMSRVPTLAEMEPEDCYLAWEIELRGAVREAQIREVFDWVEGDCDLKIEVPEVTLEQPLEQAPAPPPAAPTATPATPAAGTGAPVAAAARASDGASLRVSTDKVDALINLVGELVITQSMLNRFGDQFEMQMLDQLRDGLSLLARNTRELQETVLKIRMLPISFCFNRFPRLVHDLTGKLGKKIQLKLTGEQTELDKTVLEKISDPLVHLVRNSLDHGIEAPEVRRAAGKPEAGTVHLHAAHEGGSIVIQISDDGGGLDAKRILAKARERGLVGPDETLPEDQIYELIFAPGFSTADQVTDLSGRGVGMDVVRRNVKELGGRIDIQSRPGRGTTFKIRLPLTLAILDGQLVQVAGHTYVVPLTSIVESLQVRKQFVNTIANGREVYRLREEYIPVVRLYQVFGLEPTVTNLEDGLLMVIEADGRKAGIFVDDLLAQQQVVIKSLESNLHKVDGVSGATILGDGTVALILDIAGILCLAQGRPVA